MTLSDSIKTNIEKLLQEPEIRFAGILDPMGNLVAGGFRSDVEPGMMQQNKQMMQQMIQDPQLRQQMIEQMVNNQEFMQELMQNQQFMEQMNP